jgi:energy-coupling factor transporter ATP-binding protein EcfA2
MSSEGAALQLVGVHERFGATEIIRGVNLGVKRGERHAIIGPNGASKSTLFHLVSGRFPLSSGQVLLEGEDVTGLAPFQINRRGLSSSFQVVNIFPRACRAPDEPAQGSSRATTEARTATLRDASRRPRTARRTGLAGAGCGGHAAHQGGPRGVTRETHSPGGDPSCLPHAHVPSARPRLPLRWQQPCSRARPPLRWT